GRQLLARARPIDERPQHRVGRRIEREDRRARHEVDERLARRLEAMMLPRSPDAHFVGSLWNQFMESGTVTSRCARAPIGFAVLRAFSAASSATTQTSPTLLRLPARFGFGPSSAGVNRPC